MKLSLLLLLAALTLTEAVTKVPKKVVSNPQISVHPDAYFVVFKSKPGTAEAVQEQATFKQRIRQLNLRIKERKQFSKLLNAISLEVMKQDLATIKSIPGVKEVYPMLQHLPPKVIKKDVSNPALKYAHGVTGVKEVHDRLGLTGKGIKVGVIDSGIDYKHPALGGCFGTGCRVAYGYDFVGDNFNGRNTPVPGNDPRDHRNGHGTHVAGIIGAKDKDFVGVAPEVTFGAYRVFGNNGSTTNDIIIAAMERAYIDKMDVINLSLGGGSSWPGYPDSVVADRLSELGMVVVGAMGNEGDKGAWEASSPAVATKGIGVASIDNVRYQANGFTVDSTKKSYDYLSSEEDYIFPLESGEVKSAMVPGNGDFACVELPEGFMAGKIALVQRGNCTFAEKAKAVQKAGAVGALFYNKEFGGFAPQIVDPDVKIPCVGVTQNNGLDLLASIPQGQSVKVSFPRNKLVFDNPTGGKVSSFSSWGPGPELELKPDFAAPGGLIYSTVPIEMGSYATMSGTSMATPYVAGSVALYLERFGKKSSPEKIREAFKVTANPVTNFNTGDFTPVQLQGGGLINVKGALQLNTEVKPTMFPLKSIDSPVKKTQELTIKNNGNVVAIYELSHKPALSVQPWDSKTGEIAVKPLTKNVAAKVSFSRAKFSLAPKESKTITVRFDPPALSEKDNYLYGGYIVVTPKNRQGGSRYNPSKAQPAISIPYSGMHGYYKQVSVLSTADSQLPAIFNVRKMAPVTDKGTKSVFTLKDDDIPYVVFRFAHPCKKIYVKVLGADDRELGLVVDGEDQNLGRNDNTEKNMSIQLPFNGMIQAFGTTSSKASAPAPNGDYRIKIEVLKPFGKESNKQDWQVWTSPLFSIDRTKEPEEVIPSNSDNSFSRRIQNWLKQNSIVSLPVIEGSSIENSVLPRPVRFSKKLA